MIKLDSPFDYGEMTSFVTLLNLQCLKVAFSINFLQRSRALDINEQTYAKRKQQNFKFPFDHDACEKKDNKALHLRF